MTRRRRMVGRFCHGSARSPTMVVAVPSWPRLRRTMEDRMTEALIWWLVLFFGMSAVIVAAGVLLAKSGDRISEKTGLGGLLIGMVLVVMVAGTVVIRRFRRVPV